MNNDLNPLVSIIIPVYNREDLIGETLASVLAQTYQNWECIVVDDGSTDNTKSVVQKYVDTDPRFKLVDRPDYHKSGGNGARNYGFEISNGDLVLWFDSDDIMDKQKLAIQVRHQIKSGADVAICQTLYFKEDGVKFLKKDGKIESQNFLIDFIIGKLDIITNALIIARNFCIQNHLFWNEDLFKAQEWEFYVKLFDKDPIISFQNRALHMNRQHDDSKSVIGSKQEYIYMSHIIALESTYFIIKKHIPFTTIIKISKPLIISSVNYGFYKIINKIITISKESPYKEASKVTLDLVKLYLIKYLSLVFKKQAAWLAKAIL